MRQTGAITHSQLGLLPAVVQIVSFGWCCEYARITELVQSMAQHTQGVHRVAFFAEPRLLAVVSLLVLFIVFKIIQRSRFHTGLGHAIITSQAIPSRSIHDLLLEGRTDISDELIHNLVPRRM
jgi:hypothetical protein